VNDRAVLLGTPAVGALVFGPASAAAFAPWLPGWAWTAFGAGMVIGWVAGHVALQGLVNPGARATRRYEMAMAKRPPEQNTHIWQDGEGFYHRMSDTIPEEYWQAVARYVVTYKPDNLTQDVIMASLPDLARDPARILHKRMVGLLKTHSILSKKGNASEIPYPGGLVFFARFLAGHTAIREKLNLPHHLQGAAVSRNGDFTGRARGARALQGGGVVA